MTVHNPVSAVLKAGKLLALKSRIDVVFHPLSSLAVLTHTSIITGYICKLAKVHLYQLFHST